ncbi:hypothetical protein [Sulfobacillus thermosulfidooxidans]|uniref:hypothetical protein n=1 Tax=Sulfobacillus thermosulfidooxidans TaxID=28034 RepID=UPI0019D70C9D|nr:hypothetical protein [Sulfobacillus thermosulfidooxidans]
MKGVHQATMPRYRKKFWLPFAASLFLLSGCGTQISQPPHYKVWSVKHNEWETTTFVGPHGGIVISMASWCKYCAWEAKWQEPALFQWGRTHQVAVTLLDISPRGGIGIAGPKTNAAAGTDGSGNYLGSNPGRVKALSHVLDQYSTIYHVPLQDLTIDPTDSTIFAKKTDLLPTIFLLNAHGTIIHTFTGINSASLIESGFAHASS